MSLLPPLLSAVHHLYHKVLLDLVSVSLSECVCWSCYWSHWSYWLQQLPSTEGRLLERQLPRTEETHSRQRTTLPTFPTQILSPLPMKAMLPMLKWTSTQLIPSTSPLKISPLLLTKAMLQTQKWTSTQLIPSTSPLKISPLLLTKAMLLMLKRTSTQLTAVRLRRRPPHTSLHPQPREQRKKDQKLDYDYVS